MTIKFSKLKAILQRSYEQNLQKELENLNKNKQLNETEQTTLREIEKELSDINDKQTKGVMLRSRARWMELGEKSNKYFLGLEKRNFKNKCITKLSVNNIEITNPEEILMEEKIFYKKLYSSRNLDWETLSGDEKVQQFLENPNLTKLS